MKPATSTIIVSLLAALFILPNAISAQNLVPNPSFEDISDCPPPGPTTFGTLILSSPWYGPVCSPDLLHSCADGYFFSTPGNIFGHQEPRTGQGYAGFLGLGVTNDSTAWAQNPEGVRESMACPLIEPLMADSFYRVSFFVNRAVARGRLACNHIGATFSPGPLPPPPGYDCTSVFRDIEPRIVLEEVDIISTENAIITDTLNWVEICGIHQADGTERHLSIGVFSPFSQIDTLWGPLVYYNEASAYYYVDDVSVEKIPAFVADPIADTVVYQCSPGQGLSLTLRAGSGPLLWSTGAEATAITVSTPGWYYVQGPDTGCGSRRDSLRVAPPGEVLLDAGPDTLVVCPAQLPSLHLAQNWGPGLLQWNNGDSGPQTTLDAPGAYILSLTYACGTLYDTLLLQSLDPPAPELGPDTALCRSQFVPWTLSAPPGYDTYRWQGGPPAGPSLLIQDQGLYVLSAEYACGIRTDSIRLTFLDPPPLALPSDTLLCPGQYLCPTRLRTVPVERWGHGRTAPAGCPGPVCAARHPPLWGRLGLRGAAIRPCA